MERNEHLNQQVVQLEAAVEQLESRLGSLVKLNHPQGQYKLGPNYNNRAPAVFSPERREQLNTKIDTLEQCVHVLTNRMSRLIGQEVLEEEEDTPQFADVNTQHTTEVTYHAGADDVFQPDDGNHNGGYESESDDEIQITRL